jgi:hypothetical protein
MIKTEFFNPNIQVWSTVNFEIFTSMCVYIYIYKEIDKK